MSKKPDPTKAALLHTKTAIKSINKELKIRFKYLEKLNVAEAKRIDANRAGDMAQLSLANERAINQAAILAKQVESSAQVLATQLQATETKLNDKISLVQQTQYESKGKTAVINPIVSWILAIIGGLILTVLVGFFLKK